MNDWLNEWLMALGLSYWSPRQKRKTRDFMGSTVEHRAKSSVLIWKTREEREQAKEFGKESEWVTCAFLFSYLELSSHLLFCNHSFHIFLYGEIQPPYFTLNKGNLPILPLFYLLPREYSFFILSFPSSFFSFLFFSFLFWVSCRNKRNINWSQVAIRCGLGWL